MIRNIVNLIEKFLKRLLQIKMEEWTLLQKIKNKQIISAVLFYFTLRYYINKLPFLCFLYFVLKLMLSMLYRSPAATA